MRFQTKVEKRNRFKTLILGSCLIFGQHPKFTNKKITKYLLGTRKETELFRIKELEHILLKIYPFIYALFTNVQKKLKFKQPKWKEKKKLVEHLKHLRITKRTRPDFHLLFATTTALYQNIAKSAAAVCQISTNNDKKSLAVINSSALWREASDGKRQLTKQTTTLFTAFKEKYTQNKLSVSLGRQKQWYKKPSLVVIPDVAQSINLTKEIQKSGVPIIGLTDSNTNYQVDYPIFGNANSIHVVHFFCHLIAKLILKTSNQTQRLQTLPSFFLKSKEKRKRSPLTRRYSLFYSVPKEPWRKDFKRPSKRKVFNYTKRVWAIRILNRFKDVKYTKFWAQQINFRFIELNYEKIRVLLKLIHQFTEKQFLKSFLKWSWTLQPIYFSIFNLQTSLKKSSQNLITKKDNPLSKTFYPYLRKYWAKRTKTKNKLWETWWQEQWQERTFAGINNRYYWRRPRSARESHKIFTKKFLLKDLYATLAMQRTIKRFEHAYRIARFRWKKNTNGLKRYTL